MPRLAPLALVLLATPAVAAPVPKVVLSAEQEKEFTALWAKAAIPYDSPSAVAFACRSLVQPEAATEFLKRKLQPFARTDAEVKRLIALLDSADEAEWRPAFDDLYVYDVRLAMTVLEAWEVATTTRQKNRLGLIWQLQALEPMGRYGEKDRREVSESAFSLVPPQGQVTNWRVESKAGVGSYISDLQLTLAERVKRDANAFDRPRVRLALQVLEQIGTSEAKAVIRRMTTGHEGVGPTRDANEIDAKFARKPAADTPVVSAMRMLDAWQHLDGPVNVPAGVARALRERERVVPFLKAKLRPLTLTEADAEKLLAALFSNKEGIWKPAFDELKRTDLRLAFTVPEAWAKADTADQRVRLKWHLLGEIEPKDRFRDYRLQTPTADEPDLILWSTKRAGDGEDELPEGVGVGLGHHTAERVADIHKWFREESAIHILDAIGTDDAIAVIKDMASGHPDAASPALPVGHFTLMVIRIRWPMTSPASSSGSMTASSVRTSLISPGSRMSVRRWATHLLTLRTFPFHTGESMRLSSRSSAVIPSFTFARYSWSTSARTTRRPAGANTTAGTYPGARLPPLVACSRKICPRPGAITTHSFSAFLANSRSASAAASRASAAFTASWANCSFAAFSSCSRP
jgi:hypothetical protein